MILQTLALWFIYYRNELKNEKAAVSYYNNVALMMTNSSHSALVVICRQAVLNLLDQY